MAISSLRKTYDRRGNVTTLSRKFGNKESVGRRRDSLTRVDAAVYGPNPRLTPQLPPQMGKGYASKVGQGGFQNRVQQGGGMPQQPKPPQGTPPASGGGDGENVTGWGSLSDIGQWSTGLGVAGSALSVISSLKAGFDAYDSAKQRARQTIEFGESEAKGYEQQAQEVRRVEERHQVEDVQESYQRGTNVGGVNLQKGSALRQVLDANKAEAERKAGQFDSHADSIRKLRKQEADVIRSAGKKERTRGILGAIGGTAVGSVDLLDRLDT